MVILKDNCSTSLVKVLAVNLIRAPTYEALTCTIQVVNDIQKWKVDGVTGASAVSQGLGFFCIVSLRGGDFSRTMDC